MEIYLFKFLSRDKVYVCNKRTVISLFNKEFWILIDKGTNEKLIDEWIAIRKLRDNKFHIKKNSYKIHNVIVKSQKFLSPNFLYLIINTINQQTTR